MKKVILFYSSDDSYFSHLNRGGFCVPSEVTVHLGACMLKVLQILISHGYEAKFLQSGNQKKFFISICCKVIEAEQILCDDMCSCGRSIYSVLNQMLPYFANILLTNYTKLKNEHCTSASVCKKRKFTTFTWFYEMYVQFFLFVINCMILSLRLLFQLKIRTLKDNHQITCYLKYINLKRMFDYIKKKSFFKNSNILTKSLQS